MKVSIFVPFIGNTELLAKELGVVYNRLRGPEAEPRIPNKAWLHGYDICRGDFIVPTAETLVPHNAVERMIERHEELSRDSDATFLDLQHES